MKNNDLQLTQADQLGAYLAEIAILEEKADAIKKAMKEIGGVHEGVLFRSTVVESNRATTDWKALCAAQGIGSDVVAAHSKVTAVYSVKTTSK
jgi:predicted acetyltransferase